jgi:hypothetical protein
MRLHAGRAAHILVRYAQSYGCIRRRRQRFQRARPKTPRLPGNMLPSTSGTGGAGAPAGRTPGPWPRPSRTAPGRRRRIAESSPGRAATCARDDCGPQECYPGPRNIFRSNGFTTVNTAHSEWFSGPRGRLPGVRIARPLRLALLPPLPGLVEVLVPGHGVLGEPRDTFPVR